MKIAIAGCGALGSQIALGIATPEYELTLFDYDVVDENNVMSGTSAYSREDIGLSKVNALAGLLYYKFGIETPVVDKRIDSIDFFNGFHLVVDCFDNAQARLFTRRTEKIHNAIHIGVSPQMIGSVTWDKDWTLPTDIAEENHICTHQLGRNIITLTSATAIVIINLWIKTSMMVSRCVKGLEIF